MIITEIFFFAFILTNIRFDHANSIIIPQAFGKLRPVSSLLGHISQSQPKNLQSLIYKRYIMLSHEATIYCQ